MNEHEDTDQHSEIAHLDSGAAALLNRSDVEAQLDAAHKYPRSIKRFLQDAVGMVTINKAVAGSCIYALPRADGIIPGPSVRLAEIAAAAYGNLQIAARVVAAEEREVVAQGVCWDMEKNNRICIESRRRIVGRNGKRFNDDMITMTGNAAASIGLRNAIFRVIPGAYIQVLYKAARDVSVGDAKTLVTRRQEVIDELQKTGVPPARIFARIGRAGIVEVTLDDLEVLIGLQSAIASGERAIDELFPEVDGAAKAATGAAAALEAKLKAQAQPNGAHAHAPTAPATPATPAAAAAAPAAAERAAEDTPRAPCTVCGKPLSGECVGSMVQGTYVGRHMACQPAAAPAPKAAPVAPPAPQQAPAAPPAATAGPKRTRGPNKPKPGATVPASMPAAAPAAPPAAAAPAAKPMPPCVYCGAPVADQAVWVKAPEGWRHPACEPPAAPGAAPPAAAPPPAPAPAPAAAPAPPPSTPVRDPNDPTGSPCWVCSKPCRDDAIKSNGPAGPAWRHPDCPPFGAGTAGPSEREPGEEG